MHNEITNKYSIINIEFHKQFAYKSNKAHIEIDYPQTAGKFLNMVALITGRRDRFKKFFKILSILLHILSPPEVISMRKVIDYCWKIEITNFNLAAYLDYCHDLFPRDTLTDRWTYMYHYDDFMMGPMASQITSLLIVYSTVYSGADQSKHQSSASLAFVWRIHQGQVNSPHKWPVTRKMFPFDDIIMFCQIVMIFLIMLISWTCLQLVKYITKSF